MRPTDPRKLRQAGHSAVSGVTRGGSLGRRTVSIPIDYSQHFVIQWSGYRRDILATGNIERVTPKSDIGGLPIRGGRVGILSGLAYGDQSIQTEAAKLVFPSR